MAMAKKQFQGYLQVHGADIDRWPEDFRQEGIRALARSPALQDLAKAEAEFEAELNMRKIKEPDADLASRITAAARPQEAKTVPANANHFADWISPHSFSASALASVGLALIVGLAIGFFSPLPEASSGLHLQAFLYVRGGVL